MDTDLLISKAKDSIAKEVYKTYIKNNVDKLYENLLKSKHEFGFSNQSVILLSLDSCSALIFTTQENTGFCGEICIEYTVLHTVCAPTDIRYVCLLTQTVVIKQETEINGADLITMNIKEAITSQEDYASFLNYENYAYIKEGDLFYPINPSNFGIKNQNQHFQVLDKNILSLTKEILNQFAIVKVF